MDAPQALSAKPTPIPGLLLFELPVHGDNRGWFKENWQREKMTAIGLPDFGPVQNNISFNSSIGTTRGIHAEPWDKYVSVAAGRIFAAWVDLREGATFGAVFTAELGPGQAVYVPFGVGNAYQTLEEETAYTYLVNDHWSPEAAYTFLNLADETAAIEWPIALADAEMSAKDRTHPRLGEVVPMVGRKTLVVGAGGQLGIALRSQFAGAEFVTRAEFDVSDPASFEGRHWRGYDLIVNASGYTNVDGAESAEGRAAAWQVNAAGAANLARVATENGITLVHVSTDYVFDGSAPSYDEDARVSPLGVYGQSKAAADQIVSTVPRHYIVRTSWVVGDGANFVRTMAGLAERGVSPSVVEDQVGRLSFTSDIAAGIRHLVQTAAPFGTYNLTNEGAPQTWADVARAVFELTGHDPARVTGVTTAEYFAGRQAAPRPANSVLELGKLRATGFVPRDAAEALREYLRA